jgi:hypothetical protein
MSSVQPLLDASGRRRSPATVPGARAGVPPRNKGQATRRTHRPSMRSSPSCVKLPTTATAIVSTR